MSSKDNKGDADKTQFIKSVRSKEADQARHGSVHPNPRAPREKRVHPIKIPRSSYYDSQPAGSQTSDSQASNPQSSDSPPFDPPPLDQRSSLAVDQKEQSLPKEQAADTEFKPKPKTFTASQNKMIEASAELMALIGILNTGKEPMQGFKAEVCQKIQRFREVLNKYYQSADIENASFALCALLDRSVLKNLWGRNIGWDLNSMLLNFHQTARTEELMSRIQQSLDSSHTHSDLIEFYYLCLRMGFESHSEKNDSDYQGMTKLESALYQRLLNAGLDEHLALGVLPNDELMNSKTSEKKFFFWFIPVICVLVLSIIFSFLISLLNQSNEKIMQHFEQVADETPSLGIHHFQAQRVTNSPPTLNIYEELLPLVQAGTIQMYDGQPGLRIIMNSDAMFASGGSRLQGDTNALAKTLGHTLNAYIGTISVEGHTDNTVFKRGSIGSNQKLSIARASAFGDLLRTYLDEPGRVIVDGKAARQPIVCNTTAANRALNRRVEILLPDILISDMTNALVDKLVVPEC